MECYFAYSSSNNENQYVLNQEDSNHIVRVLRHKINDEIVVIFKEKKYLTKIISLNPVVCEVIKGIESNVELPVKITLVMALLKEQKFDLVIQKAVELGVYCIVPIQMQYCVSNLKDNLKKENKINRWQKIAKAAAQQSNRNLIPKIMPIISNLSELKNYKSDINFVAYEKADINNWEEKIKKINSVTIVVGPEGGISDKELKDLFNLNFVNIRLGKTILRAETAPLYFLSIVNYYCNK